MAYLYEYDGWQRKGMLHLGEDTRDIRDDKGNKEEEHASTDKRHEDWIGQRRFKTTPQGLLTLAEFRQVPQDHIQGSGSLARVDHVDVEI